MNENTGKTRVTVQRWSIVAAVAFIVVACIQGYRHIGLPPVVIVGGSGIVGFIFWYNTYLKYPTDPKIILPLFLLTVGCLEIHMCEEYLTQFGPAMSRLFDISWTEKSFMLIFTFIGPVVYTFAVLGLFYRVPLAGFVAWFIFIGPGVAEFTHFIFPFIRPALNAQLATPISEYVANGRFIENMPNYYYRTTGTYYFPGMGTAILPMVPGIFAIYKLTRKQIK